MAYHTIAAKIRETWLIANTGSRSSTAEREKKGAFPPFFP